VLLWVLIAIGGVLNALMISLVEARNLRIHLIMSGIIAIFVALLVFVTASLDHPYAGPVSVDPDGFAVLLEQLIVGKN
jgi:sugar phosphate permease